MNLQNVHEIIRTYFELRDMQMPNAKEALDFFVTEVGELMDAFIRTKGKKWKRNTPDKEVSIEDEMGDCYMMLEVCAMQYCGKTLLELMADKMVRKLEKEVRSKIQKQKFQSKLKK